MEKLINWLRTNGMQCYQIFSEKGKRIVSRQFSDTAELLNEFPEDYESLPDGNYTLKANNTILATRKTEIDFTVGTGNNTNLFGQKNLNYKAVDIEAMKREAFENGKKEAYFEMMVNRLDKLERRMEDQENKFKLLIKELSEKLDDLDGTKDGDFLEKIGENMETVKGVKEMMENFKM